MQPADASTILGNFDNARFEYHGVVSTFHRKDGRYFVRTDGPDGKLHEYEIAYTFGARPLQQYLIAFPRGHYQALNVCWDTRPATEGGQRWFHLYPNENVNSRDVFHWTGPYQNWNFMCAECHSTSVTKNYRPADDSYETTWFEIDVSCEACHGPGSAHAAWGEAVRRAEARRDGSPNGLVVSLKDPAPAKWEFDMARGIATRSAPRISHTEIETCARCHARRSVVTEDYLWGRPFMDAHRPALLTEGLYYDDGQIKDEVYEYGSFLQSRMYAAGVTCSDCHDPHSLKAPIRPDAACARCHLRERFDTPAHHFHKAGSPGASCVECHMPARNYMVVDPRRDHSFRVPRPDLSVKLAAPSACVRCHKDRSETWAAQAAATWWPGLRARPQYAEALHAGRAGLPGAERLLSDLAGDASQPGIARATAISMLSGRLDAAMMPLLERVLGDPDPLVRDAGVDLLRELPPTEQLRLAAPLLSDPVRVVRIDAGRLLASAPREALDPAHRSSREAALGEYRSEQAANLDRAEGHMNLGTLHIEMNELDDAERDYRRAIELNRWFTPAYVHLAELYRMQGRDAEGERVLRLGLESMPDSPDLYQALGLSLARQKRLTEALGPLQRAAELGPQDPRYAYVFAIALNSAGKSDRALAVLRAAHAKHAADREILAALATISRDRGERRQAIEYAKTLVALSPGEPSARALLEELERAQR